MDGDDLDDDLNTVLFGRALVLVAGLDKARQQLGERLFAAGPDVGQAFPADFSVPEATCKAVSP